MWAELSLLLLMKVLKSSEIPINTEISDDFTLLEIEMEVHYCLSVKQTESL